MATNGQDRPDPVHALEGFRYKAHAPARFHNQFLRENAEFRQAAPHFTHLSTPEAIYDLEQAEARCSQIRLNMRGDLPVRRQIQAAMPYIPLGILNGMCQLGSILYEKYFSTCAPASALQPDFTIVQLLALSFWRVGPNASRKQLKKAIIEQFPWYNRTSQKGKLATGLVVFVSKDCYQTARASANITTHIKAVLEFSATCHQPLFTHDATADCYSMVPGFEAETFPCFGLASTTSPTRRDQQFRFDELPEELRCMVIEKYYDFKPLRVVRTWQTYVYGTREPLLIYHESYGGKHLPKLGPLLSPSLVSKDFCRLVREFFPKKVTFDLGDPLGSLPDWHKGLDAIHHASLQTVTIALNFSDHRGNPTFGEGNASNFRKKVLKQLGEFCHLRKIEVVFDIRHFGAYQVHLLEQSFRTVPEIKVLCRFRGIQLSVRIKRTDIATGHRISYILGDRQGEDTLDDEWLWLKTCMASPKKRVLPCPALTPEDKTATTIKRWTYAEIASAAAPYGPFPAGCHSKADQAAWLSRQMSDDYRNPGEV